VEALLALLADDAEAQNTLSQVVDVPLEERNDPMTEDKPVS